jgi:hypothetical protein
VEVMKTSWAELRVGDWVEVRTKAEILATLDSNGQLDGMPFMPEMLAFCGRRFQVYKAAHKTCDTVFPVRGRRVERAVHLDTRCDGSAHGGCQASCLIFWKEAWLKPTSDPSKNNSLVNPELLPGTAGSITHNTESIVWDNAQIADANGGPVTYVCQATRLPYASLNLDWWEPGQYVEDFRRGNVGLWTMISGATYFIYYWLTGVGIGLGRPLRWVYDHFYFLWAGAPFPRREGAIPEGTPTPIETLDLQPGELVRVKPYHEILKTLNTSNRNRGLFFDAEEVPYCGKTYRVLRRVERIVNERTGRMLEMKTPCIVLDSVICRSRYSECRLFCPRSIFAYWREIWLERLPAVGSNPRGTEQHSTEA